MGTGGPLLSRSKFRIRFPLSGGDLHPGRQAGPQPGEGGEPPLSPNSKSQCCVLPYNNMIG